MKKTPGSKAAMKKGREIHKANRERHREKMRRKAEQEQNDVQSTE